MVSTEQRIEILLVEDNPGDILLTTKAFKNSGLLAEIHVATDDELALDFLKRRGAYADAVRPDLVLLDTNLPKVSGLDVLQFIKADPSLRVIPVVMLSSSDRDSDRSARLWRNVNSYIKKPSSFRDLTATIEQIKDYAVVKRPPTD